MTSEQMLEIARVFNLFADKIGLENQHALGPTVEDHAERCRILDIENTLED